MTGFRRFYVPMFLEWIMPRKPGFTSKYCVNCKMDPVWGLFTICEVTYPK